MDGSRSVNNALLEQKGVRMESRIKLSYFYGKEAEQYSFYKIPKLLFTDDSFKKISVEAKVLYGLMLDRMSLSMKNQWLDGEGRAYIYYSLEDIMEALGCSNKKAITIMKELDSEAGIGLIEKKRQGQGKPTMIYLKQFVVQDIQKCNNYISGEKTAFVWSFIGPRISFQRKWVDRCSKESLYRIYSKFDPANYELFKKICNQISSRVGRIRLNRTQKTGTWKADIDLC